MAFISPHFRRLEHVPLPFEKVDVRRRLVSEETECTKKAEIEIGIKLIFGPKNEINLKNNEKLKWKQIFL